MLLLFRTAVHYITICFVNTSAYPWFFLWIKTVKTVHQLYNDFNSHQKVSSEPTGLFLKIYKCTQPKDNMIAVIHLANMNSNCQSLSRTQRLPGSWKGSATLFCSQLPALSWRESYKLWPAKWKSTDISQSLTRLCSFWVWMLGGRRVARWWRRGLHRAEGMIDF